MGYTVQRLSLARVVVYVSTSASSFFPKNKSVPSDGLITGKFVVMQKIGNRNSASLSNHPDRFTSLGANGMPLIGASSATGCLATVSGAGLALTVERVPKPAMAPLRWVRSPHIRSARDSFCLQPLIEFPEFAFIHGRFPRNFCQRTSTPIHLVNLQCRFQSTRHLQRLPYVLYLRTYQYVSV